MTAEARIIWQCIGARIVATPSFGRDDLVVERQSRDALGQPVWVEEKDPASIVYALTHAVKDLSSQPALIDGLRGLIGRRKKAKR